MNALNGIYSDTLNPADRNPARIAKTDKYFAKKLDFKYINFPVKVRDLHKFEKNNSIDISVFGYENEEKHPIYVLKKCCKEKHVDLLLIEETFFYTIGKFFCPYCLQVLSTKEILKHHVKDCFKLIANKRL